MSLPSTKVMDDIFFKRVEGLCAKHSECKESTMINDSLNHLKNNLTSHEWRSLASSILLFELDYNDNVTDLMKYAELRASCAL